MRVGRGLLRAGGRHYVGWQRRSWHDVTTMGRFGLATTDGALPRPLRAYLHALHARPRTCAVAGAAAAGAAGDILAQLFEAASSTMNGASDAEPTSPSARAARTLTHAALVGALVGGVGDLWFRSLLKKFPGHSYEACTHTHAMHAAIGRREALSGRSCRRLPRCRRTF